MKLKLRDLMGFILFFALMGGGYSLSRAQDQAAVGPVDPFMIPVRTPAPPSGGTSGQAESQETAPQIEQPGASSSISPSATTSESPTSTETGPGVSPSPTPKKVNIKIKVTGPSSRILGGVKISFSGKQVATVSDPPPLNGTLIKNVEAGSYEVIAERTTGGYELYDENLTIPEDKSNFEMTIQMKLVNSNNEANNLGDTSLSNTGNSYFPPISDPTGINWWNNGVQIPGYGTNNWGSPIASTCGGFAGIGCPIGYRCVYQKYGGIIASDATGQCVSEDEYQRYQGLQNYSLFGNNGYNFPTNYNLSLNQSNVIPTQIRIDPLGSTTTVNSLIRVSIFEKGNNSQPITQNTVSVTEGQNFVDSCLKPNTNYVMELLDSGINGSKPLYYNFTTPSSGYYFQINISSLSFIKGTGSVKTGSGILTSSSELRSKCQQQNGLNNLSASPINFSDPSINATDLLGSGNFQITRDWRNGGFYMINLNNRSDVRKIYLIEATNNSANNLLALGTEGHRGMGFFSAEPDSFYNQNSAGNSGSWYMFIYQTDPNGDNLKIVNNQMSRGNISPTMYSNLVRNQFLASFANSF